MSSAMGLGLLWLVRSDLMLLAILLAVISKWQMLIGGPRLWLHTLRDNAVDLSVLASILGLLGFYSEASAAGVDVEVVVIAIYLFWQLVIKPMGGVSGRGLQALTAIFLGTNVLFIHSPTIALAGVMVGTWLLAMIAADHYLSLMVENPIRHLLITVWGLLSVEMAWVFGRWNVIYQFWDGRILLPQASIVIVSTAYIFGVIYYEHVKKSLSKKRLNVYMGLLTLLILCIIIGSEWVNRI